VASNIDDLTAIRTRFLETWDSEGYPAVFDNEPPIDEPHGKVWARLSVQPGTTRRLSINARTYEVLRRIYLQIFTPEGLADNDAWTLAETFTAAFRDWKSADLRLRCSVPEYRTDDSEADYFAIIISVPYTAQH
jgi:hypothetical protein